MSLLLANQQKIP